LSVQVIRGTKPRPKPYLTSTEEEELTGHLIDAVNMGFGKTQQDVLFIVERHVEQKMRLCGVPKLINGWWVKLLKRNPSLNQRSSDSIQLGSEWM